MKNIVCIILARGGSKAIPKKNLINFCGKPLLTWSIDQAKNTRNISSIWVSSDDDKILKLAKKNGVNIIKRPKSLSTSKSSSVSGWIHAINYIEKNEKPIDMVVALQVTSPVREPKDIEKGIKIFFEKKLDSLFSAAIIGDFYIWKIINSKYKSINYNYKKRPRRQEFPDQYVENGSFYIFTPELIKKNKNPIGKKIGISLMEFWKSFQIDEFDDILFLKILMKNYLLKNNIPK